MGLIHKPVLNKNTFPDYHYNTKRGHCCPLRFVQISIVYIIKELQIVINILKANN